MKIHKKRWIQSGIALFCSLAIVLSVFPSFADEDISSLESQSSSLQNELSGINEDILALNNEIEAAQMQIEILDGEISRTEDALSVAEADEEKQYSDMKTRIKYMYENGNASLLEMLFSAENMSDFLNKADFIENLSEYDRDALEDLKRIHQEIENQNATLEEQQTSLAELRADLDTRKSELQAKADATATDLAAVQERLTAAREAEAARIAAEQAAQQAARQASASGGSSGGNSVINGGSVDVSADDVTLLAAILECEAVQDYDCLLAVATVIMNRVQSPSFPNTISGVIYASGQFEPVWTGRLQTVLDNGPTSLSMQVAQDAINGARLASVSHCYYFLYAPSTSRDGVVIGNNLFFPTW